VRSEPWSVSCTPSGTATVDEGDGEEEVDAGVLPPLPPLPLLPPLLLHPPRTSEAALTTTARASRGR